MKFLPLTLLLTLAASLLMALVFIPVLGAAMSSAKAKRAVAPEVAPTTQEATGSAPANANGAGASTPSLTNRSLPMRLYLLLLEAALRRPAWVVGGAVVVLVWSSWLYERYGQGSEFLPDVEPTSAVVLLHAPGDLSLDQKRSIALEAERIMLGYGAFESVFTRIGQISGPVPGSSSGDVVASLLIEFRNWREHAPADGILDDLEQRLTSIAGVKAEVRRHRAGPPRGKAVELDVTAPTPKALALATREVRRFVDSLSNLENTEDSRPPTGIEWRLDIDRAEAARFGVDVAKIGQYARFVTRGLKLGELESRDRQESDAGTQPNRGRASDEEIDILMRFPERYRNIEGLRALRVSTARGAVPLDQFATLTPVRRAGSIERIDGVLARSVKADMRIDAIESDVARDIKAWTSGAPISGGAKVRVRGDDEDKEDARDFLFRAFAAALFTMALILVAQFNSFYSAFLVLFGIVLATVGVRIGLLFVDMPFGVVMSGIGVIALAGIVVNNNIILIDTYNRLRREGLAAREALMRTGDTRLRPVLLTTVTTIAGLMPLVLRIDVDFAERAVAFGAPSTQYWVQMSSAVVFGLAFATVLTLFITPAALMLRENISAARSKARAAGHRESIASVFERDGRAVGIAALTAIVAAWIFIPEIVAMRSIDILSKQIFEQPPSRWFQALESASFWSLVILGAAYAYWRGDHVRVDIIRDRLSNRGKALIEIAGFLFLLGPVCVVVLIAGWEFVVISFVDEEASGALLGSPTL